MPGRFGRKHGFVYSIDAILFVRCTAHVWPRPESVLSIRFQTVTELRADVSVERGTASNYREKCGETVTATKMPFLKLYNKFSFFQCRINSGPVA